MCTMLPYATGICCYAFNIYFIASVHSFFTLFRNLVLLNRWNGPQYQCVLLLALCTFFFKRGNTKGTKSSKILCLMFVYVLFCVNLWTDLVFFGEFMNIIWWLVCRVNRRQLEVCFSPDIICCGWLGYSLKLPSIEALPDPSYMHVFSRLD